MQSTPYLAVRPTNQRGSSHDTPGASHRGGCHLVAATLAGDLATRLGQPAVLEELLVGMLLGNLTLVGFTGLEHLKNDASLACSLASAWEERAGPRRRNRGERGIESLFALDVNRRSA